MRTLTLTIMTLIFNSLQAQETIPLYAGEIPNSKPNRMKEVVSTDGSGFIMKVSVPALTIFLPPANLNTGKAVIICPGGGYMGESYTLEGTVIAQAFNRQGIAAFLLKYRLPSDSIMADKSIGPLQDAQQAIKVVRERAAEWKISPDQIGIMGFSAGGHLASTAGTHFNTSYVPNPANTSLRPDFLILVYPVISMQEGMTHGGSKMSLLGGSPSKEQVDLFSNELQVNKDTPPAWLTHTGDDTVVPVENSIRFYQALIRNGVPAEMHLYPNGNHGFILKMKPEEWMGPLFEWIMGI